MVEADIISTKKRKTYGVMQVGIKRSMKEVREYSHLSMLFYFREGGEEGREGDGKEETNRKSGC